MADKDLHKLTNDELGELAGGESESKEKAQHMLSDETRKMAYELLKNPAAHIALGYASPHVFLHRKKLEEEAKKKKGQQKKEESTPEIKPRE